jgi:hypothetical protein
MVPLSNTHLAMKSFWYFCRYFVPVLLAFTMLFDLGCAVFTPQKRVDFSPYAESVIGLTGDVQAGLSDSQTIYLRDFVDGPEVARLFDFGKKSRTMIRHLVGYSIDVVTIGNAQAPDHERNQMLGTALEDLADFFVEEPLIQLDYSSEQINQLLDNVRSQKMFLEALDASQLLIDDVASAIDVFVGEINDVLDDAVEEVHDRIWQDNKFIVDGNKKIRNAQIETMDNISFLQAFRHGDKTAMDSLLLYEPLLRDVVADPQNIASDDLIAIEQRMIFKLTTLSEIRTQLKDDLELYNNQLRELDLLAKQYDDMLRKTRIVVLVWSRAHAQLASGTTDPAKIDVAGLAIKATNLVVP